MVCEKAFVKLAHHAINRTKEGLKNDNQTSKKESLQAR